MVKYATCFLAILVFPFLSGCTPGGPDFSVEVVEGVVTLDGAPIEGVTVGFSPTKSDEGKPAVGRTDASGKFVLTATQGGQFGKGAMIGKYDVTLTKDQPEREPTAAELAKADQTGEMPEIKIISVIPKKYNSVKTSGLTAEVVAGQNTFAFEAKSKE